MLGLAMSGYSDSRHLPQKQESGVRDQGLWLEDCSQLVCETLD